MIDFCFIAVQVVVCLMVRKTVPLMNYVQVSNVLNFADYSYGPVYEYCFGHVILLNYCVQIDVRSDSA